MTDPSGAMSSVRLATSGVPVLINSSWGHHIVCSCSTAASSRKRFGSVPSKGESRIVPTECQIEVGLEGLAALGSSGQIREEKPCSDLDGQLARRQPGFICRCCAGET